jgi:hypothetical protein
MIRFAVRQFRTQAEVGFGALVLLALVLLLTGLHLSHVYDATVAHCAKGNDCAAATSSFLQIDPALRAALDTLVVVVPGIIGVFWGAPLIARELEGGTFRLAWTQGVTRSRWLLVKLGVVGLASMATAGLMSLMVTWWSSQADRVNMGLFSTFGQRDIAPIGYAAFAFVLGLTVGVMIRRTVPAMATTLVAFVVVRVLDNQYLLPHLLAPTRRSYALALGSSVAGYGGQNGGAASLFPGTPNIPNAWVLTTDITNKAGQSLTPDVVKATCPRLGTDLGGGLLGGKGGPIPVHVHGGTGQVNAVGPAPTGAQQVLQNCVSKIGATYHEVVAYQPPGHYWPLQWIELGLYLAVALALAGLSFWWIRRRLS